MTLERVQKALARAGVASRRKIEELVHRGRVTINGEVAQVGDKVDLEVDHVKVDGKRIQPLRRPHLYLLLNKPPGYVSTVNDPEKRLTVLDLIPQRLHKALFPVGRLDYDSEGLLLLTSDGEFSQRVAHPSLGCTKLYEVKVKGQPDPAAMAKLHKGITLDGRHVAPVWVESFGGPPGRRTGRDNSWYRVALKEGRTRQIREMFFRVGHPVMRLKRTHIGGLTDPFLRPGKFRELEPSEIELLLSGAEPARRAERLSRGRPKVKLEDSPETPPRRPRAAKPVRRRITEPLPEDGAPPAAARQPARPPRPPARPAAPASAPQGSPRTTPKPAKARSPREEAASEWQSAPPRESEEWSSTPPARRPAKPLFEESEFEDRRPSIFYGGDDESWDEPLDGPPAAAGRGRRQAGGEWASGAAERPRRPARVGRPAGGGERGGRPAGGRAGDRPPAGGPARPRGPGRPPGRSFSGEEGASRPPRPRAGRPSFGGDDGPRPRSGAGRSAGRASDAGEFPHTPRPSRPARPRNGAGRNAEAGGGRPSGRPAGRPTDRPASWRPGADGPGGGRPSGGGRPGGGRPGGGSRPGGKPSRPGGGPSRPSGGKGRPGGGPSRPGGGGGKPGGRAR